MSSGIRPHLEYAIHATHPIPRHRGIEKGTEVRERASNSFDYSLTHRRIRGDLISMLKTTNGLQEFPMDSTFTYATRKKLRCHVVGVVILKNVQMAKTVKRVEDC